MGGDKQFVCPWGTGGGGDKHFTQRVGQTFYVGGGGGYDDVNDEMDVSEASFYVSNVCKIFKGPIWL